MGEKAGGTSVGEIVSMAFGRFQYGHDPDGNSLGLFDVFEPREAPASEAKDDGKEQK